MRPLVNVSVLPIWLYLMTQPSFARTSRIGGTTMGSSGASVPPNLMITVQQVIFPWKSSDQEPESKLSFESSDACLAQTFNWAKKQAMAYIQGGCDPVGPWYETGLLWRTRFSMHDTSHQAMGQQALGLSAYKLYTLRHFAEDISDFRDWCSFWGIHCWDQPASVDYKNDAGFWYDLPANFDVLDASTYGGKYAEVIVKTLPSLTKQTTWTELRNLPIRTNVISVRHEDDRKTTITNQSGPSLIWQATFAGSYGTLLVNGRAMKSYLGREPLGQVTTWVRLPVGAADTVTVELPSASQRRFSLMEDGVALNPNFRAPSYFGMNPFGLGGDTRSLGK